MKFYVSTDNVILSREEAEAVFDEWLDEYYPNPTVILGINFYAPAILHTDLAAYQQEFLRYLDGMRYLAIEVPWEQVLIEGGVEWYVEQHRYELSDDL